MRILKENDKEALLHYLEKEPEMNLFFTGDLENFGMNSNEVSFYLHEEKDRWDFVILRFYEFFILYSQYNDFNADAAIEFFKSQEKIECISGNTSLLEKISFGFKDWEIQSTYMSRCNQVHKQTSFSSDISIRLLTKDEVGKAIDLLMTIEEFRKTYENTNRDEQIIRTQEEMDSKNKVIMGAFRKEKLLALAETSAETTTSAMIVGVATALDERKHGYASAVVSALCENCFSRNMKFLCLFYDNPEAGRIYNRIGFEEIGLYGMLR